MSKEHNTDVGHPFYADGSEDACRWCSQPQSAHPPGEIATRAGFQLRLMRRLVALDLNVADDVVQELMAQDREIASLRAEVRELRAEVMCCAVPDDATESEPQASRERELCEILDRAGTVSDYALDALAARLKMMRNQTPHEPYAMPESDDELRTRIRDTIIVALWRRGSHP